MTRTANIYVTLEHDNEFGISDSSMFIRQTLSFRPGDVVTTIDLGPPTIENFYRLLDNMKRLECHLKGG